MVKIPHKKKVKSSRPYHHGNLVEALVAVTVEIIEERGVEHVSVREAAKRAGVSPGAPFQHFRSKTALLTAVAEQAMGRLTQAVAAAQANADADKPIAILEAIGQSYLQWALANPTHFEIINSRTLIDFEASDSLRSQNAAIRQRMIELLTQARERGQLIEGLDLNHIVLTARALVYGLARMAIDGHFPRWHPSEPPPLAMRHALRLFIGQITASPIK
jgi:AcrR family transcriptional regulator